ncbi:MAG: lysophospholipid acyltransferase family protein [Lutibacter sp.]|uniref:lysophospholipid acyltransferase family protein n=1 Tax=Lutibacter sp. TaxID=1925666 RepID=UPI00299D52E5|nr:lysophospholipid acyltransferase family protein [Lutibacter sp.]MDX1830148.1 lysophospholipid acyltransferase family protein [Lutibacter sp.]
MINLLVYILVYPFIWFLSILPFRILYTISDGVYFLLYYIIGYRKKVVYDNLKLALPEKSEAELLAIRKQFYHHFVDIFIEMIKSFTISEKEVNKRYTYTNIELLSDLYKDGKSLILLASHYANWEWMVSLSSKINYKSYAAFTKISNSYFNNKIKKTRARFGLELKETWKVILEVNNNHENNIQSIYGLLSDQSPQVQKTHYWNNFLGVKVPIHTGTEMLAKKYDLNVAYIATKKIKRGYYESTFNLITTEPKKYADYEITDMYLRQLEAQIYEEPAYYFWTHKRFKHKDKAPK